MSAPLTQQVNTYCCVMLLVNQYIAVHVKGENKKILSKPSKEIEIAQAAAKTFAEAQNPKITYDKKLRQLDRPIITVITHNSLWYPAGLHSDRISLLTSNQNTKCAFETEEDATDLAKKIAKTKGYDYLSLPGITIDTKSQIKT